MNYNNALLRSYIKSIPYKGTKNFINNLNKNIKNKFDKPIGLYDPFGENINPLTNLPYQNIYADGKPLIYKSGPLMGVSVPMTYMNLAYYWTNFLVYPNTTIIMDSIRANQITLAKAGTGTGKTVLIPKIALQALNFQKKVIVCIPKTAPTQKAADFAAKCLDVPLGEEVGYYYRGKQEMNKNGKTSKLIFTTTGSLISKVAGDDPYLDEYSCVVIDEAHERSVQTDFLFLYLKKALEKRKDLKVVIMSATINLEVFINYFPSNQFKFGQVDAGEETLHHITDYYEPKHVEERELTNLAVSKIMQILNTTEKGDIIVFVKSGGDGRKIITQLEIKLKDVDKSKINPFCTILEAKSNDQERELAISEILYMIEPEIQGEYPYTRKIVASTNLGESSVTIDGLVYVIDTGYNYIDKYFPAENARALIAEYASQSAVKQRRGRGGRTQDGFCYHLYTEKEFKDTKIFKEYPTPDIQKSDLCGEMINLLRLEYIKNVGDMKNMLNQLIAPPDKKFVDMGMKILHAMGCIDKISDDGTMTEMGKAIARFRGVDDIYSARAIIASYYLNCKREVIAIIVLCQAIESRMDKLYLKADTRGRVTNDMIKKGKAKFSDRYGDMMTLLNIYHGLKDYMRHNYDKTTTSKQEQIKAARDWCTSYGINPRYFVNTRNIDRRKKSSDSVENKHFNWDIVEIKTHEISDNLIRVIQPAELRKKYFNEYKKNEGLTNITAKNLNQKLNEEIKKINIPIIGKEENLEDIPVLNKAVMVGGYDAKPYELNLFPNLVKLMRNNTLNKNKKYADTRNNVFLAICQGFFINISKQISASQYQTVFPLLRKRCTIDKNSSITRLKQKPKIIIYNELFMTTENQAVLKMNISNSIPQVVLDIIKKDYKEYIDYAFSTKIELDNQPEYMKDKKKLHGKRRTKTKTNTKTKTKKYDKVKRRRLF